MAANLPDPSPARFGREQKHALEVLRERYASGELSLDELTERVGAVIFSPAFRQDATGRDAANMMIDPRELVEWVLADGLKVRVGLQLHKFIWEPQTKGV